ncbi:hypothetical protein C6P42_001275 [Pichia californica]|nr:hypothetical protein C6P42_001275 [[Candida] californica]
MTMIKALKCHCCLCMKRSCIRQYSQLPKLGFIKDIEQSNSDIDYSYTTNSTKNNKENKSLPSPPLLSSMSRIFLSKSNLNSIESNSQSSKDRNLNNNIINLSNLPSWYERLQKPSSYMINDDISLPQEIIPFRSFQRCYAKVLSIYTDTFLSLTNFKMKELLIKYQNENNNNHNSNSNNSNNNNVDNPNVRIIPQHLQKQNIKIDLAIKKLSELSSNTYILYKRLKVNRLIPPFYLHQQFLIHLGSNNISKLLDLYFELPQPRPFYLKREEFEKFMSLLLRLKFSNNDHKLLIPKIIDVYNDIREFGNEIQLTPFENTKYLSILLNDWSNNNTSLISEDEMFNKIIKMKSLNSIKRLSFCPAMWNLLLIYFPKKTSEIMKLMSNESGLTRLNIEIYLKHIKSFNELNNLLELMKLKFFHLDTYLLNLIILKLIEFNKSNIALNLINEILIKFNNISNLNWSFSTKKIDRIQLFKIDVLNKTFQQLHNEEINNNNNNEIGKFSNFTWLRYKFKPSPLIISKLLINLNSYNDQLKLLNLMIKQNIPIVNKHAINLLLLNDLNQIEKFKLIPLILSLVKSSLEFNKTLHRVSIDSRYDTNDLSTYIHDESNEIFELKDIFKISLKLYDDNEHLENVDEIRIAIANQLVSLNDIINK